jgi:acetyltransferase-like isoleucine patch superfamily enzyme
VNLGPLNRLKQVLVEETQMFNGRLYAVAIAGRLLRGHDARIVAVLRLAGSAVGDGTRIDALPRMNGQAAMFANLTLGRECLIAAGCSFDLEERITVGDRVRIGAGVMILTSTHDLGPREHRAGPVVHRPVVVEAGAVLGARSILLPGITVGERAVVSDGAVVTQDVPAHTRVAGIPAVKVAEK